MTAPLFYVRERAVFLRNADNWMKYADICSINADIYSKSADVHNINADVRNPIQFSKQIWSLTL